MARRAPVLILAGVAACSAPLEAAPPDWQLAAAPARLPPSAPSPPPPADDEVRSYTRPTTDPESSIPTGGAVVRVDAPLDVVHAVATDFGRLHEALPGVEKSVVLRRARASTDVYLTMPLFRRSVTAWALVRFSPVTLPGGRAFVGTMIDGNLDELRIACRLVPDDVGGTVVSLELFADLRVPVPAAAMGEGLASSAGIALEVLRDRARAARAVRPAVTSPRGDLPTSEHEVRRSDRRARPL